MLLRRLGTFAPTRVASSITVAFELSTSIGTSKSSTKAPPSASGTTPWILDSCTYFHMTHDHVGLSSIRTPIILLFIPLTTRFFLLWDMKLYCPSLFMFLVFLMFSI
jgi:hypothetical protein